jgi:hypothetical protein
MDDAAVVEREGRVNEIAAERPEARQNTILVSAGQTAVSDNIGDQYCRKFPDMPHRASGRLPSRTNPAIPRPLKVSWFKRVSFIIGNINVNSRQG